MDTVLDVVAWVSALAVVYRLRKYFDWPRKRKAVPATDSIVVSIIIPARNEAKNLPKLLVSLQRLTSKPKEILVVDDSSTDNTSAVAAAHGATVISAGIKPEGWAGKNWACHVGAQHASGELLLFTDADTTHTRTSLARAVKHLQEEQADMLSAPSYHRNELWWEKLLGPFHCLIHCGASPYDKQSADEAYAVGQYILIKADAYDHIGGHLAVRSQVAEDTSLARATIQNGLEYILYTGEPLFTVQMYPTFIKFCKGWIRLLRLGMRELSFEVSVNSVLPLLALNLQNLYPLTVISYVPIVVTLVCFAFVQRHIGNFSIWGLILFPVPIALFVVLSCWAMVTELLEVPIRWKGRVYAKVIE